MKHNTNTPLPRKPAATTAGLHNLNRAWRPLALLAAGCLLLSAGIARADRT